LQVINQYKTASGKRYDVTVLVNGLPLVHIELKKRGTDLRKAFNDIKFYNDTTFADGGRLFEYAQLFIISNGTNTKYFANAFANGDKSDGWKFTSFWSDSKNEHINDLTDFVKYFFAKHSLLNMLTKYMVFDTGERLLAMRPYQIFAAEAIISKILCAHENGLAGTKKACGYIWHTTGSGKTLTSFKTAQLVADFGFVDKVLFVVDRKDLDNQTVKEYNAFTGGTDSAELYRTSSARDLAVKLDSGKTEDRIAVTTIQKLGIFIKKNKKHDIFGKNIVIIFDECHRSQFGDWHKKITSAFKKYFLFGFTGTPIMEENAVDNTFTTDLMFNRRLHSYTIVDAIDDENVLKFNVSVMSTLKDKDGKPILAAPDDALHDPVRIESIVDYVIANHRKKTKNCFNAIFAADKIATAKTYYEMFEKAIETNGSDLKIAIMFSQSPVDSKAAWKGDIGDEEFDVAELDDKDKNFLSYAIGKYNKMFTGESLTFDASDTGLPMYYADLCDRVKKCKVDILIVVNMFLTGFDAKCLNTLYVDKNLKYHGLIQAFSRTNRTLDAVKDCGNIICFRNLKENVDAALALFADKTAAKVILIREFKDYYDGYIDEKTGKQERGYKDLVDDLKTNFPLDSKIMGEEQKKEFVKLHNELLKKKNICQVFDEFDEQETLITPAEINDYKGRYLCIYEELRNAPKENKDESDEPESEYNFELELITQDDVTVDYILALLAKYVSNKSGDRAEDRARIDNIINSTMSLRPKKELIDKFIDESEEASMTEDDVAPAFRAFCTKERDAALTEIIKSERLDAERTIKFMNMAFRTGNFKTAGTAIAKLLPPIDLFGDDDCDEVKNNVVDKLATLFNRYGDL